MKVEEKYIWIIGSSEGIGRSLAYQLGVAGANIAVSARNQERLKQLTSSLSGTRHLAVPMDVTDINSIMQGYRYIRRRWPHIDMVIYNTSTYVPMRAQEMDLSTAEFLIDTNLTGAFRIASMITPHFLRRDKGHFVIVSGDAGSRGLPDTMGYGASKAGLIHFAESLYLDLLPTGIGVQIANPPFDHRKSNLSGTGSPFALSPESAAQYIVDGIRYGPFEIEFPRRYMWKTKLRKIFSYERYFPLINREHKLR